MPTRRFLPVLLGLLLALVTLAPPSAAATTTTLSATVTNTDGVPQSGSVCLERVGSGSCSGNDLENGAWSTTWESASDTPGDYLIQVTSETMDGLSRWYKAGSASGTADKAQATPVHLAAGAPDLHFTMVLPAIAKVRGKVVDSSGRGVAGLPVLINEDGLVRSVVSGAGGAFDLGYTRAGDWTLHVNGGVNYLTTQRPLTVPATGLLVVPNIVVQSAATVAGRVTDSVTGNPIPFVEVEVYTAGVSPTYLNSTRTDADGRYLVGGLAGSSVLLRFKDTAYSGYQPTLNDGGDAGDWDPQTPIVLAAGEHKTHDQQLVPVTPAPLPAHTLSGTVTDTLGRPLANINVVLKKGTSAYGVDTDRLGRWSLNAPDGDYTIGVTAGSRWSSAFGTEAGWAPGSYPGTVTVAGGAVVDGLDVQLGRALANVTAPSITGVPTPGRTLTAAVGTWSVRTDTTYTTTWLRDGVEVGTGSSYAVRLADIGHTFRVRVVASHAQVSAQAQSAPRVIGRVPSAVTVRATSRRRGVVKLAVAVSASGVTPAGALTVKRGSRILKRAVPLVGGRAVVVLRKQRAGRQRYTVTYSGSPQVAPATAASVRVRVR